MPGICVLSTWNAPTSSGNIMLTWGCLGWGPSSATHLYNFKQVTNPEILLVRMGIIVVNTLQNVRLNKLTYTKYLEWLLFQLYSWDFNLWRWVNEDVERLMPLKGFYYLCIPQRRRHNTSHRATWETSVLIRKQKGVRGKPGPEPLLFSMGKARQGKGNCLGLAGLNNLVGSELSGWPLVVWYLTLGDLGQGEYWLDVGG